jgi:hypothetical protein
VQTAGLEGLSSGARKGFPRISFPVRFTPSHLVLDRTKALSQARWLISVISATQV